MAGKMPKLNCTLTSTTTAKTADTKWLIQYVADTVRKSWQLL